MRYLFILDYHHLDNGGFLKLVSKRIGELSLDHFMIIHGDSAYTDRIIQTGMMREDAVVRSVKELNHRLTALFADEGVPLIALNAYQRGTISRDDDGNWQVDAAYLKHLGTQTNILLSNLTKPEKGELKPMPLSKFTDLLHQNLQFDHIIAFDSTESHDEIFVNNNPLNDNRQPVLPDEIKGASAPVKAMRISDLNKTDIFKD